MRKLIFQRRKYGKELLIDAANEEDMELVADRMVLTFYAIIFIKKGSGTFFLDTEEITLDNHQVIFVKPGQINRVDLAQFDECQLLFFEGDFLDEFFNDKNFIYKFAYFHNSQLPSYLSLDGSVFQSYYQLAKEIKSEILELNADSKHILRSIVYYLLVRLNQAYGKAYGAHKGMLLEPKMLAFLRLVENEIQEIKSVQEFADVLQISRVHLNKLCQKHFSKPAKQIIKEQLFSELKKEIKYSNKGFSEIAYDFNFSAPSHFSRFIKKMSDLSPQELRDNLSKW